MTPNAELDYKKMYLEELSEKLKYEQIVERRSQKIRRLKDQLSEAEYVLRKIQRVKPILSDMVQEYFEDFREE
tara:strand:+ start:588 stop:806 length:219 start_codon:yes stop_codon:yes gene_type:complete